jgi:hypothetical protein
LASSSSGRVARSRGAGGHFHQGSGIQPVRDFRRETQAHPSGGEHPFQGIEQGHPGLASGQGGDGTGSENPRQFVQGRGYQPLVVGRFALQPRQPRLPLAVAEVDEGFRQQDMEGFQGDPQPVDRDFRGAAQAGQAGLAVGFQPGGRSQGKNRSGSKRPAHPANPALAGLDPEHPAHGIGAFAALQGKFQSGLEPP